MKTTQEITFQDQIPTDTVVFPDLPDRSEVHIWRIDTSKTNNLPGNLASGILSSAEHKKIRCFRRSEDAARYAMSHFWLRKILAGYCKISPESVSISKTILGKPVLDGSHLHGVSVTPNGSSNGLKNIDFSISHSQDLTVISIATGAPTGIDAEFIDLSLDPDKLSVFCLSEGEQELFSNVEYDKRLLWFLTVWTAKEAALKYLGTGFSKDIRTCECRYRSDGILDMSVRDGNTSSELCRALRIPMKKEFVISLAAHPASFRGYRVFSIKDEGNMEPVWELSTGKKQFT